ncbi:MAG: SAM-dependent methyltransferase [Planctomycetota bacterium]|nr:SAM-dependent methyltransferase [Planctomycetota bacterium]MDA1114384.1 SAM-dependent methyltransferase [Planctomycetota bacterium]
MIFRAYILLCLGLLSCQIPQPAADFATDSMQHIDRMESDHARDAERKPAAVLEFFGIQPGMAVADVMAGDGYYTELLSRIVGPEGTVYCQNTSIPLRVFADAPLTARLANQRLANVMRLDMEFEDDGFPTDLDVAILVRFYHDFGWQKVDREAFNALMFASLKPGGVFGVIDHHAKAGAGISEGRSLHRIEADFLQKEIEAAGFVLEQQSSVLTNASDTLDWSIFDPEHEGRDTTSRFVYLFRKPL